MHDLTARHSGHGWIVKSRTVPPSIDLRATFIEYRCTGKMKIFRSHGILAFNSLTENSWCEKFVLVTRIGILPAKNDITYSRNALNFIYIYKEFIDIFILLKINAYFLLTA